MNDGYSLTHWEYEELLAHLQLRSDIWSEGEGLWVRTSDALEPQTLLALQLIPPDGSHRFRRAHAFVTPVSATPDWCDAYFRGLIAGFTGVGERNEVAALLREELSMEPETAEMMSIAIAHIYCVGTLSPEKRVTQESWMQLPKPGEPGEFLGQWPLLRGGWIRLQTLGGELVRALISIHGPDHGKGYAVNEFVGTLHTRSMSGPDLHKSLFGWETEARP